MTQAGPVEIVPVILSGGSGARLWPVSRALYPKQLLPMVTGRSMLQETAVRAGEMLPGTAPAAARSISIDHAVMERTDRAAVIAIDPGWSDIGSWPALWELVPKDGDGNASRGDTLLVDTRNSLVRAESRLVATVGVDDIIVVETADAVLVADKAHGERVRAVVEALKAKGRSEADAHAMVHRPWGAWRAVDRGAGFRVKRITVDPGGRLSLQRHTHRAEHWVVIHGTARVTRGPSPDALEVSDLPAGRSIDIPLGWVHRLECLGDAPCVIIEVQTGEVLSEDDIERLHDSYGRS